MNIALFFVLEKYGGFHTTSYLPILLSLWVIGLFQCIHLSVCVPPGPMWEPKYSKYSKTMPSINVKEKNEINHCFWTHGDQDLEVEIGVVQVSFSLFRWNFPEAGLNIF